jgi:hypothetical protein
LLSVALSVTDSSPNPFLAVSQYHCLWSPDFPPEAASLRSCSSQETSYEESPLASVRRRFAPGDRPSCELLFLHRKVDSFSKIAAHAIDGP